MRTPWPTLVALALLAPLALQTPLQAQTTPAAASAQARVIVKFKAGSELARRQVQSAATGGRAATLGERVGVAMTSGAPISDRMQVFRARGLDSAALAARLSAQADVEYAVPDERRRRFVAPNDPLYAAGVGGTGPAAGQWYLRAPVGTVQAAIDAEPAWDISTGSSTIVVADLDTGIRYDHADLKTVAAGGNLLPGYDMITDVPTANDTDGRDADPSDPGDWVSAGDLTSGNFDGCIEENSSWHGTQTAGLIGALTNNSLGMASVGRTVRVLPVRVLGKCGGYDSDIIAGMRWAAGAADVCRTVDGQGNCTQTVPATPTPAKVINMSLGGEGSCSQAYRDAVAEVSALGTVVVASAGNSEGHAVSTPANCPGVIAVTGLRHVGSKVGFADVGPQVAIAAPGGNCVNTNAALPCLYPILTTTNAGTTTPVANSSIYTDAFNASVGTSFSAPLVSGTVGLMFSAQPSMTPSDVRAALQGSARIFPNSGSENSGVPVCHAPDGTNQDECYCTTSTCGAGMLDAGAAVAGANRGVQARITASTETPRATQLLTLNAASSFVLSPRTITAYQWAIVSGGGIVTTLSSTSGATATVTPSAAGRFTVSLTVTDSTGAQSTSVRAVDVTGAPLITNTNSGGGGGGALGLPWLLGLTLAVVTLQWMRNRQARARSTAKVPRRR
ncbi:MAG: S8 family serine peptidase [Rhizobacter sp.]|nr:S8 family serine peptidase [Rhizobacter sp.]